MAATGVTIPVTLQRRERRGSERFVAAMPVRVEGADGTTQDLSASGLSFVADRSYDVGSTVEVVIEYILDGHHYPLRCLAEVVRVQPGATGFLVGARLMPQLGPQDVAVGGPAGAARLRSIG